MVKRLTTLMLAKDLYALPRRKWFYLKRTAFLVPAAGVLIVGLVIGRLSNSTTVGLQLFRSLSVTALAIALFLAAIVSGMPVLQEKREKTLGLLLLTDMTWNHQVFGRLLAGAFFVGMAVFSMFPLFVFCGSLGGISAAQIASAFIVVLGATFLGCCLGLLAGAVSKSAGGLVIRCLLFGFLVFVLVPLFACSWSTGTGWGTASKVGCVVSPFTAMFAIGRGRTFGVAGMNCLVAVVVGLPFLLAARFKLPSHNVVRPKSGRRRARPPVRPGGPPPVPDWAARRTGPVLPPFLRPQRRPASTVGGNPVAWKDLNYVYRPPRREWRVCIMVAGVVALVVGLFYCVLGEFDDGVRAVGVSVAQVMAAVFFYGTVGRAARSFNREKENRAIELLMLTDLTDWEILRGKVATLAQLALPWLTFYVVGTFAAMLSGQFWHSGTALFWGLVATIGSAFFYSVVAMQLSMRFKTVSALAMCFAVHILFEMIVKSLVFVPLTVIGMYGGILSVSTLGSLVLHMGAGVFLLRRLGRNFRALAFRPI